LSLAAALLGPLGFKGVCIAPPLKFGFMRKDKRAFQHFVDSVAKSGFDRIVVSHGDVIEDRAREIFIEVTRRFVSSSGL
jgi:hypothetical protein